jgi:hypothetical protein
MMEDKEISTPKEVNEDIIEDEDVEEPTEEVEDEDLVDEDDDDFDFDDNEEEVVEEEKKPSKKPTQSKEENAKRAQERRNREAKERAKRDKDFFNKGLLEGIGGINPYTNKKIEDDDDLEIYQNMREAEKEGFEPIEEYSDFLKFKKNKELKEKEAETTKEKETQEKAEKDFKDFSTKYPNVNVKELLENEDFMDYAEGKLGNQNLSDIYSKFLGYKDRIKKEAKLMAKRMLAKKKSSVGSKDEGNTNFSASNINNMSDKDFDRMLELAKSGALSKK